MPISDYLPGDCLPKAEDITPGGKKVIEQVMNGTAFKNPMAGKTTEITGKLNEAIGKLDPVIDNDKIEALNQINLVTLRKIFSYSYYYLLVFNLKLVGFNGSALIIDGPMINGNCLVLGVTLNINGNILLVST